MPDYNKINERFTNKGLNVAIDPDLLDYGQYQILNNWVTNTEGVLEVRPGMTRLTTTPLNAPVGDLLLQNGTDGLLLEDSSGDLELENVLVTNIQAIRRLNNIENDWSGYILKAGTAVFGTVDGSNHASTTVGSTWQILATGLSNNAGHILVARSGYANTSWAFVTDPATSVKVRIKADGTYEVQNIGIHRPTGPPTLAGHTTGSGGLTTGRTYTYRYTLYNSITGVESLFNSAEATPYTTSGADDSINVTIPTETLDPQDFVDNVRIYRIGGSLSLYRFVGQAAYTGSTITFTDHQSDLDIASATLLNLFSDRPFTVDLGATTQQANLGQWAGPLFGYILAIGDPLNPGYLYWSDKFGPETMDPSNKVEVESPNQFLQSVFIYDNTGYVFTPESLYRLQIGQTENVFTPYKTSCARGLYAADAYCIGPSIFFMAKDGIYATNGGQETCISETTLRPIFHGETADSLAAIDFSNTPYFRMAFFQREVWFQYRGVDTNIYLLAYHVDLNRWRQVALTTNAECMYTDEGGNLGVGFANTRFLLGTGDGYLTSYEGTTDAGTPIPTNLVTNQFVMGAPLIHKEWGALVFDVNPNSQTLNIAVNTNKDSTNIATASYTDAGRVRKFLSLADTFSEDITIHIASTGPGVQLFGYELLYRPEEPQIQRWSVTGVTHGIQGWQILRDLYLLLRSDGTLTLTVTVDGSASTYTVPSTTGAKRKVFIPTNPLKGKVFDYKLELGTATFFRLYTDQCEVYVKPWVTNLGYYRLNPFSGTDAVNLNTYMDRQSSWQGQQG